MAKPRGAICNLECKYCFYLDKKALYPDSNHMMSDEVLSSFTKQYIEAQRISEVTFAWQGGEPALMGIEFFERALYYQKKYCPPGMKVFNALQTNGTRLTDEWCRFLKKNNFLVGISLDGPRELHDANRIDKNGASTFEKVMDGVALLKKHQVDFNILTCISASNVMHPLDVYRFLRDEVETQFIQFIPIVERLKNYSNENEDFVNKQSITGMQYGNFLITIFDEWIKQDVGNVFVQIFDVALGVWYGHSASFCVFAETCGTALALEHNGDLYSCDHFVDNEFLLGNIQNVNMLELGGSKQQILFGQNKRERLHKRCKECEVRFICNGGCPKDRILEFTDGEPALNYLCDGYKTFFTHIDEPMKKMADLLCQRRPPADIMLG